MLRVINGAKSFSRSGARVGVFSNLDLDIRPGEAFGLVGPSGSGPAEMLGVDSGLGYAILDARDRLDYPELMGVILLIGVLGTGLDLAVRRFTTGGPARDADVQTRPVKRLTAA